MTGNMTRRPRVSGVAAACVAGLIALTAAPLVVQAQAPAAQQPAMREGVAAMVDDEVISTYDLRQRVVWLILSTGIAATQENMPEIQREALLSLIDERLQAQEIRRQEVQRKMPAGNLFVEEARVDRYLADIAGQNKMTAAQFVREVEGRGVSAKSIREQARINLSWQQWTYGFYGRRVKVSEEKISAMLRDIVASASKPSYLVSEIFIDNSRAGGADGAMATARQLVGQLQQSARFDALARQYSALPSAANGGDTGWLTTGELAPAVESALENLRPGQVTQPIQVQDGVYVILLREKRAGSTAAVVNLKQIALALPADATPEQAQAAQVRLLAVKSKITGGCNGLQPAIAGQAGLEVGDLGQSDIKDLAPAFRDAVEKLEPNQVSEPVRTAVGLHLIALCSRTSTDASIPTREEIEDRLFSQELAMIQRRELRNLRAAAIISQPR